MSDHDYRDELIATQRALIKLQAATIETLRAYLKAAHAAAEKCKAQEQARMPRKDVQA